MIYLLFALGLIGGILLLIIGANFFVTGASSIAKRLKISPLIIGLTIVAVGTSLPELAVSVSSSITAAINETTADISLGNIIGSNIANISLVMGVCLLFGIVETKKSIKLFDLYFFFISAFLLVFFLYLFDNGEPAILRFEGIFLIFIFLIFIGALIYKTKKGNYNIANSLETNETQKPPLKIGLAILLFLLGLVGVVIGGVLTTYGAENLSVSLLSDAFGMDVSKARTLIGLSVVAVGTSLPELVTSVVALRKKETELSLGNVVGSNIFNILLIVGISGSIFPLSANKDILFDSVICLGLTIIFSLFILLTNKIGKKTGLFLILFYIAYLAFIIIRSI
ncbi:MAG: calcium/sodium antiporter [Acholeplasmatales bacterium]|jgi:cation:H+ antiporter|nr:calcium/sodium antiporter [Acholeplasmatales bacterium]